MDLTTKYLGFELPHPFIAGASPLADSLDSAKRLEDAGAAAIVMRSLFEEQLNTEALATHFSTEMHAESFGEATSYFADPVEFVLGPDEYLEKLRQMKEAIAVPVIASLNCYTDSGWLRNAKILMEAGADAIEFNLYFVATDPDETSQAIEQRSLDVVGEVSKAIKIPIAVKLSPFYTSMVNFACALEQVGAAGVILFNRFFEADINIDELEMIQQLHLSTSSELLLRLRWLAIISGNLKKASLAVTGGVHSGNDAIKAIMCGASAVQLVSTLFKNGPNHLNSIKNEMVNWMEEFEYESLQQMLGCMNINRCPDPGALSRANYVHQLQTFAG